MFDRGIFRARLRELRKKAGESQAQLAQSIGVSTNQVSEMEKGTKTTTLERFCAICEHYNVSADYLLGRREEENDTESQASEIPPIKPCL
ncbi:helix-turn-helix domain-containing protein [Intestinimonas sp.]|uniref:helix-turn-helix domain-containing protein n=1 Tax=Intestinimonas sp. TaxID=1965293 RepID=UPI0026388B87|nr:helix-turn-helix transcriptional regulator [Intestinimonas sp.]